MAQILDAIARSTGAASSNSDSVNRLDWKTVDLDRKIIEVRAGQAKTASRRVIPISDNLAAWLTPLDSGVNGDTLMHCPRWPQATAPM